MFVPASAAVASLVPVLPTAALTWSAHSAVMNGVTVFDATSNRSVIETGGVTLLFFVTSKKATNMSALAVVTIDGAVNDVELVFT